MSADLYNSEIDDELFGTLSLEMNAGGWLRIIAYDPGSRDLVGCCQFPPTSDGIAEANRLINALNEWIRHTSETVNPCRVVLDNDVLSRSMSSHNVATAYLSPSQTCVDCREEFWTSTPGRDICAACLAHREQECE
jgi:hypothetical protein